MATKLPLNLSEFGPDLNLSDEENEILQERISHFALLGFVKGVQPADSIGLSQEFLDALEEIGRRHYEQKSFESASLVYSRLVQLKPRELKYFKALGASYLGMERYDSAIQAYRGGQFWGALDAELHYYMGLAHYFKKEFLQAFELIRFARALDEKNEDSDGKIAEFASQILPRIKPFLTPEHAANMDLRPD